MLATRVPRGGARLATLDSAMGDRPIRVAAVGDLHCRKTSAGSFAPLLAHVNEIADVLLLCGDLADHGLEEEAHMLAKELAVVQACR